MGRSGIIWTLGLLLTGCDGSGGGGDEDTVVMDTVDMEEAVDTAPDIPSETGCAVDMDCDDADPCTTDTCDTSTGDCSHEELVDADGDGYPASMVDGVDCGGSDCDDADETIHPDADLDCEGGGDFDCDTLPDPDEDDDGYVTQVCEGDDCDDADPDVYPGAEPGGCVDEDHDCNGQADRDNDGDGEPSMDCGGGDCDDADPDVYFGASELNCDGKDNDCSGEMSLFEDRDQDGYARPECVAEGAEADCNDDPDSGGTIVHPGAEELCNDVDEDCDGSWAEGGADDDLDGYLDEECGGDDCNDDDDTFFPGSLAVDCSTLDHDCNGVADQDNDDDGEVNVGCGGTDCDDTEATINTASPEVCLDGRDNDCDDITDGLVVMGSNALLSSSGVDVDPDMLWTGSELAIAWIGDTGSGDVYFTRVNGEGYRNGSDVQVTSDSHAQTHPSITWSGSHFGVVWKDDRDTTDSIYMRRLDVDGTPLGSELEVSHPLYESTSAATIAWSGSEYGVVQVTLRSREETYFTRVSAAGSLIGSGVELEPGTASHMSPFVTWGGSTWAVAWVNDEFGDYHVRFVTVSPSGTPGTIAVPSTGGLGDETPVIAWSGSEYGLVWVQNSGSDLVLQFARLDEAGAVVASAVTIRAGDVLSRNPDLVWTGSHWAVAWYDGMAGLDEVQVRILEPDASWISPFVTIPLEPTGRTYRDPSLVWTGSELALAMEGSVSGGTEVRFTRVGMCD